MNYGLRVYFFYDENATVDDLQDADFATGGNRLASGTGREFLDRAMETDLHLTLTLGGNAQIDIAYRAHCIVDVEGTIVLELHHLAEEEEEDAHEKQTHENRCSNKQGTLGNGVPETDTRPTEAE